MFKMAKGRVARQAYVGLPDGTYEDEHGRNGFLGRQSHLYRLHAPTQWTRIEGNLRPRLIDTYRLAPTDLTDPRGEPIAVLSNPATAILVSRRAQPMPFYCRNVDADELHFIHKGSGTVETDYGPLEYEEGDYILIPKGTNFRFVPKSTDNFSLIIESKHEISLPDFGLIGPHTIFDKMVLVTPDPKPVSGAGGQWEVRLKGAGSYTSYFYRFNPMDVVGWKGDLSVIKLNVRDIRPLSSERIHLPPTAYCTFRSDDFLVATFAQIPIARDPEARPIPPYHRNVDYDEVQFPHWVGPGLGVRPGLMDFTPQGVHHGPPPEELEAIKKERPERLEIIAIMIDVRQRLALSPDAAQQAEIEWRYTW